MNCLTAEQCEALMRDELPRSDASALLTHAEACDACSRLLAECRENEALLFGVRWLHGHEFSERPPPSPQDAAHAAGSSAHPDDPGGRTTVREETGSPGSVYAYPKIPGYEILSVLRHGAQGVVYKALQHATRRTVAIKVLLARSIAGRRSHLRFEREIDLASSLQHPNVVTVFDSGTVSGVTYLVMEYVQGTQLNEFLRENPRLTIPERLNLFLRICAGVSAAHRRGVIHRDLKPGNIMVDLSGAPKVLDFGLAKAVGRDLVGDGGPVTLSREFVGTLAYASPEQTRGNPDLIDTRTDVYSLGVILFQMITGQYPYPVVGSMADIIGHIASTPPVRPSDAMRRATVDSDDKRAFQGHIARRLDEDLETIMLQTLAKERERRYQSVDALVADIERYRQAQPIDAKRDSVPYVMRKFAQRNRSLVGAALAVCMVIAGALGGITAALGRAKAEFGRAQAEEYVARRHRDDSLEILDVIRGAVDTGRPIKASLRPYLEARGAELADTAALEPAAVVAAIHDALGVGYSIIGAPRESLAHLDAALEEYVANVNRHADRLVPVGMLAAEQLLRLTEPKEAEARLRALQPTVATAFGGDSLRMAELRNLLAGALKDQKRIKEARQEYEAVLAVRLADLGPSHIDVLVTRHNLLLLLIRQYTATPADQPKQREELLQAAAAGYEDLYGDCNAALGAEHAHTLAVVSELLQLLGLVGRVTEAEALCSEWLPVAHEVFPEHHWRLSDFSGRCGRVLERAGRHLEAASLYAEAASGYAVSHSPTAASTLQMLESAVRAYHSGEAYDEE